MESLIQCLGGLVVAYLGTEKIGSVLQIHLARWTGGIGRRSGTQSLSRGVWVGALLSFFIQSGSATTSMVMGFVGAELMSLAQAAAVILGGEIGGALVVGLALLPFGWLAPWLLTVGFVLILLSTWPAVKRLGHLLIGCGLLWLGMTIMDLSLAGSPLEREGSSLAGWTLDPAAAWVVGALAQAILQSATLVMLLLVAICANDLLSLTTGLHLIVGILWGPCLNALLQARDKPPKARKVAVVLWLHRSTIALLAVVLLPEVTSGIRHLSDLLPEAGNGWWCASTYAMLNLGAALLFFPLIPGIATLAGRLAPDRALAWQWQESPREKDPNEGYQARYLNDELLSTPNLALEMARREAGLLVEVLDQMVVSALAAVVSGDLTGMSRLRRLDERVDQIHEAITHYLSRVDKHALNPNTTDRILAALTAIGEMESIGDIIENNFYHLAESCVDQRVRLAPDEREELDRYHQMVVNAVRTATSAFLADDAEIAREVMTMKEQISGMNAAFRALRMRKMQGRVEVDWASHALQTDLHDNLKRLYYHAKRIAKLVAKADDAAAWSDTETA